MKMTLVFPSFCHSFRSYTNSYYMGWIPNAVVTIMPIHHTMGIVIVAMVDDEVGGEVGDGKNVGDRVTGAGGTDGAAVAGARVVGAAVLIMGVGIMVGMLVSLKDPVSLEGPVETIVIMGVGAMVSLLHW